MKKIYIYAGCNGAGKSTAFETTLLNYNKDILYDYLNMDRIAKGISPFNSANISIKAGRLLIEQMNELINNGKNFAFETTLSGRAYKQHIENAKAQGYNIILFYYWLNSVELAKERVQARVNRGGHNVPENDIERRYYRGINNLFSLYLPIVNTAFLYDNSNELPYLFAKKYKSKEITIINEETYNKLHRLWTSKK